MTGPKPLEEDLKLAKYRNSYWIVIEPEGIPLVEFVAQHHDTPGEPLHQSMRTHLSRESILEFHESGKFDRGGFKDFMESRGCDISAGTNPTSSTPPNERRLTIPIRQK